MHKHIPRVAGAAVAVLLATGVLGAPGADAGTKAATRAHSSSIGSIGSIDGSIDGRLVAGAVTALRQHARELRLTKGQSFRATDTVLDRSGSSHVRMTRTYRGLPVLGGDLVVHRGADGSWAGVSRTLTGALRMSTVPRLSRSAAQGRATRSTKATRGISHFRAKGTPRLVVDAIGHRARLAWAVTTSGRRADGTPSRMTSYVDARTGAVLRREERIETVDGSGQSLYSGTVPLKLTQSGSTYSMKDPTRGNTYTNDVNNKADSIFCTLFGVSCQVGTTFTSTTTTFGNGTNANRASAGVDAQYGTNETWDYYNQVHGRAGIFGNGTGSWNRVHYDKNYVNAFWDGTKMTYGDGDGVSYGPLVSLDVAGHEMSHGVTENTAGLTYSGESGGLNESTSDIFGTMVEFFADNPNDPGDYLIGEEFDLAHHLGLRRMDNPASDGQSANCWDSNVKNLDVHYSSGVGNHFFYLLAEGTGAKTFAGVVHNSPTCNGSTITGIGRDAAQRIWFRALTVYMTSGETYAQARSATLSAAQDLYRADSTQYNAVAAAWSAVSVS